MDTTMSLCNPQNARRLYGNDAVHVPLPGPQAVDGAALEQYRRDGFLAVENVFTAQEVEAARQGLQRLITGANAAFQNIQLEAAAQGRPLTLAERPRQVRKLFDFTAHDSHLQAMSAQGTFLDIVERLVGNRVRLSQEMALLKPAHIGREKPWHQDMAYFLLDPPDGVIGTWIALDRATPANGCMHVIPGSQRDGPRPHYHDRDCQLADDDVAVDRDVVVPLPPGGVLFFHGLLHHGTPPNRSADARWALQFHYAALHCRVIDAAEHGLLFADRAGYAGCTAHLTGVPERSIAGRPHGVY
jgi:phytanoyl-CoA hydroxylase